MVVRTWLEDLPIEDIIFSLTPFWIRLFGLPPDYIHGQSIRKIANLFGAILECNLNQRNRFNHFVRLKVEVTVTSPLFPGFFIDMMDHRVLWIQVKYEKLGLLCSKCGCIGHESFECLTEAVRVVRKHGSPEVALFGPWLDSKSSQLNNFEYVERRTNLGKRPCSGELDGDVRLDLGSRVEPSRGKSCPVQVAHETEVVTILQCKTWPEQRIP